jgi:mannose-6-phosphate isomerase
MLYPLKFKPVYKDKIWGGQKIRTRLGHDFSPLSNCGEAWLLSGVAGSETVIANGFLAGNDLNELLEVYMDELAGEKVYGSHSGEFPILIKIIDANDWLSVQVHPDDALAARRNLGSGKTEMWYVLDAEPDAKLISGFNRKMDAGIYQDYLTRNRLQEILNFEEVRTGDVFFIPSGRVHALGPGILLAEIQQTSDTTYRIYDWDRVDHEGKARELHTGLAMEAIDFKLVESVRTNYSPRPGKSSTLVDCPSFTTNLILSGRELVKDYSSLDSFVIFLCTEGRCTLRAGGEALSLTAGEVVLIPAVTDEVILDPDPEVKLLEVYIP